MSFYNDPLADVIGSSFNTRPVFRTLPRPHIALVQSAPQPAPAVLVDDDLDGFDPAMPEEPDDFRAMVDMSWEAALQAANDDDLPLADQATVAEPIKEKRPQRKVAKAAPARRPDEEPTNDFVTSPHMRSSHKLAAICAIVADPALIASTKAIAAPLVNKINPDLGFAFISLNRLGEAAVVSWKTAQRAVRDLESAGWIEVDRVQGSTIRVAFRPEKLNEIQAEQPKTASRSTTRTSRSAPTPDSAVPSTPDNPVPGSDDETPSDLSFTDDPPDRAVPPTPDRAVPSPLDRAVPHNRKAEGETMNKKKPYPQYVRPSPPPYGTQTTFDSEWAEFRDSYPVEIADNKWKGAFIRARMEGFALDQLVESAHAVEMRLLDDQMMMCVARFFADERYKDNGRTPRFHEANGLRSKDAIAHRYNPASDRDNAWIDDVDGEPAF